MSVESVNYINDLDPTKPAGSDKISLGDDHIRNIKTGLRKTFPKITGEVTVSQTELNYLADLSEPIVDLINSGSQGYDDLDDRLEDVEGELFPDNQPTLSKQVEENTSDIADIRESLNTGTGDTELAAQVAQNKEDIKTNSDRIDTNARKIEDHSNDIQVNAGNIQTNADNIQTNADNIQTNVDNIQVNANAIGELWDAIANISGGTGGMIKVVQQPDDAGDFRVNGFDQTYRADIDQGSGQTARLDVPEGMVFCFEYLFGFAGPVGQVANPNAQLSVDVDEIYIDGVKMYNPGQGYLYYTESGGPIWPGNDKSSIIRVEESIEVRAMTASNDDGRLYIAGIFAEA